MPGRADSGGTVGAGHARNSTTSSMPCTDLVSEWAVQLALTADKQQGITMQQALTQPAYTRSLLGLPRLGNPMRCCQAGTSFPMLTDMSAKCRQRCQS